MADVIALKRNFKFIILLTFFVMLMEAVGGIFSNSLALLSDAGHVLIDFFALVLTYFSFHLSKKASSKKFSFGYHRFEILTAIVNGIALVFVTLYIFYESYRRFLNPSGVKGAEMLIISSIGLMANFLIVVKMRSFENENLSVRSAYLHVLSDTLSSIGVVIAGVLIIVTGNNIFDLITSFIIGIFILFSSLRLISESANILMESTPQGIDVEKLSSDIISVKGVKEIHDLHVWTISSSLYALSSHVVIDAKNVKSMNKIISRINGMLKSKYKITHTVIQSECENCADGRSSHN